MKLSPDDPKLTAYALGELDTAERVAVENALANSPEARAVVEEIRAMAGRLTSELAAEPSPELTPAQCASLESAASKVVPFPWHRVWRAAGIAAAACVVGLLVWSQTRHGPEQEVVETTAKVNSLHAAAPHIPIYGAGQANPGQQPTKPTPSQPSPGTQLSGTGFTASLWGSPDDHDVLLAGLPPGDIGGPMPGTDSSRWSHDSKSGITSARFTPDGRRVLTATGNSQTARLWNAQTGQPITHPITAYAAFIENAFVPVLQEPLSTFSIDVDTASYANVRRFLNSGQLPPRDAVRIEELINYFSYAYPAPRGDDPFSASIETAGCPWAPQHRLVRVALKGRELPRGERPPGNFVFLIDVSGSMQPAERLPLLKQALRALVKELSDTDRVGIVVYASDAGVKLESMSCAEKEKILAAIDALEAGGSTNGGGGIQQAYAMARRHFIKGAVNRVLLCTDGDFNVGLTDQNALVALVKENAASGVFLTTLGVGTDNYKDALMQRLADRANGNYHYLDTLEEAQKVLIEQMNANLVTIAKDVKIQVEFNPAQVSAYRLIGYEKRMLRAPDFNNDRKDAGEIGAGHTVTAFYEIVPAGAAGARPVVDTLKYQSAVAPASYSAKGETSKELLTLKLRYKQPDGGTSKLVEFAHTDSGGSYGKASADFKFAASVAGFGMILRGSEHKGGAKFETVLELAAEGKGPDHNGWRAEFINLVKKAMVIKEPAFE